ncbi:putative THO complex subunit 6-like protein, partial [Naja naja]
MKERLECGPDAGNNYGEIAVFSLSAAL